MRFWDQRKDLMRGHSSCSLSILFVRFSTSLLSTVLHAGWAFNSLCEIPGLCHHSLWWGNKDFFQFSLWDSEFRTELEAVKRLPFAFNSLCEIRRRLCSSLSSPSLLFQFSLWDSDADTGWSSVYMFTFNSLCEIRSFKTALPRVRPCLFQFSLWDSSGSRRGMRSGDLGTLSILFVRF